MTERTDFPALRWQDMPFEGRVLIEASAGTGKTHNIGLIWLRLLIDGDVPVEKILVTTFTEAAAQELRERLRRRLTEFEHWLRTGEATGAARDDALRTHFAALRENEREREAALRRVRLARADFDRAPIATIHSLCLRIQRDFPFDAAASFATSAPTDGRALLRECIEDFWRRRFLGDDADAREVDAVIGEGPERLQRDVEELLAGEATLVTADGQAELDRLMEYLRENVAELGRLADDVALFARKTAALRTRLREVATALLFDGDVAEVLKGKSGECVEEEGIKNQCSVRGAGVLVEHPLILALRRLRVLSAHAKTFPRGRVIGAALAFCRAEVPLRAQRRDTQTFAMLIDQIHARITTDGGRLAERLHDAFSAALIDEFQDTDRRQFEIFDRIFRAPSGSTRGLLVMIGDPKQAIFGFRGGDVFAYLAASKRIEHRYALLENHRSSRALVAALNALYASDAHGMGAEIGYRQVRAASSADDEPYATAGTAVATPLQFHWFCEEALGMDELEERALQDCAGRIIEVLSDAQRTIAGRRVDPGDIAVLVPRNAQIGRLREMLVRQGVPCVGAARDNVLQSDTARDLRVILHAVLNPDDDRAVRGALATALLGATYADVLTWQSDLAAFEAELERFAAWHELAHTRGVLALIDALIARYAPCWLARADGKRIVTDLRHLGEQLAQVGAERHGLPGLYAWLVEMSRDAGDADLHTMDARKPRVDSDERRVQIMTTHNAKGLEFPIVFLPLAWRNQGLQNPRIVKFHDAQGRECADAGSAQFGTHREWHFREDLEERRRLLYVAMTRAVHALHVYWAQPKSRGGDVLQTSVPLRELLEDALGEPPRVANLARLSALPGTGVIGPCADADAVFRPAEIVEPPRRARTPLPAPRPLQWLHSFSSLTRKVRVLEHETQAADETESAALEPAADIETDTDARLLALQHQRGPRFGDAVHALLERAADGALWPAQREFVVRTLREHGVRAGMADDAGALEAITRMVDRARGSELDRGLRLVDLRPERRVAELEFQLPLRGADVVSLRAVCAAHGFAQLVPETLSLGSLDGMLTGFIDLVFAHDGRYHVLDYKTNWLGGRLADYASAALDAAMRAHHYDLQALLYTVALHRYLGVRLDGYVAETHLGESWYLFLRGAGLAPGLGVWRRRWPAALIRAVDALFAGVEVSA